MPFLIPSLLSHLVPAVALALAPTIAVLEPGTITAGGPGFTLTVTGTGFAENVVVRWRGEARPTIRVSDTRLRAEIGSADITEAGTARVTVLNRGTEREVSNPMTFSIRAPTAVITALTPMSAPAGGEPLDLIVTGTAFASGAVVRWNGEPRGTTVLGTGMLRARITALDLALPDTGRIKVANPGAELSGVARLPVTHLVPQITRLTPSSVPAGSAEAGVTVEGRNFIRSHQVRWNGATLQTTFISSTQIRTFIPGGALESPVSAGLTVTTSVGSSSLASAPAAFTVGAPIGNPVPALASVGPTTARAGVGPLQLTVNGSGFVSGATIHWNGAARVTTRVSANLLTAVIPTADLLVVGDARVTVVNPAPGGGTSAARSVQVVHFAPAVSAISPAGVTAGSADIAITVTGNNFLPAAEVHWNNAARQTSYVSATQLRALIPASDLRSFGTANVTVVTRAGQSLLRSAPTVFTVSLGLGVTVEATPQLRIASFHIGGAANPPRVMSGSPAELHVVAEGIAPTHWRVSERADLAGAGWNASSTPARHTFTATTSARRTLYFQYRFGDGAGATLSNVAQDEIEVRVFSTAGLAPNPWPGTSGEHFRLECPVGVFMSGVYGMAGLWLDNIGIVCNGTRRGMAYTAVYGGVLGPYPVGDECPMGSTPELIIGKSGVNDAFLRTPVVGCPYGPFGGYDPVSATPVRGVIEGPPHIYVKCPAGAVPIGLDVFAGRVPVTNARSVSALGMLCARLE
ncbi:hypothetical protein BH24GEM1_BH24GEM1_18470 [soil metagenome]